MEDTAKEYGFGALKWNAAEEDEEYNEMYYIYIHLFWNNLVRYRAIHYNNLNIHSGDTLY